MSNFRELFTHVQRLALTCTHMALHYQYHHTLLAFANFHPQRMTFSDGVLKKCACMHFAFTPSLYTLKRAAMCRSSVVGFDQACQQLGSHDLYSQYRIILMRLQSQTRKRSEGLLST